MFQRMLEAVREKSPLIHNITNYVTVNDCANIVIACGAAPIMADDREEVEEITTICGGIDEGNITLVRDAGASGACLMSSLMVSEDVSKLMRALQSMQSLLNR